MAAVIREVHPSELGWEKIRGPWGERVWKKPDGTLYEFAPGARQVVAEYRRLGPDQILDLTKSSRG